jgi:hypothetical protein
MQQPKLMTGLRSLFVIGLIATGLTLIAPDQAQAKGQCHKINTMQTSVIDASFKAVGEFKSGLLKGTSTFEGDLDSVKQIPGPSVTTVSYAGILEITTDKGTLTTLGVGVFETVPSGIGVQFDRVLSGTGLFAGATGFLYYTFTGDASGAAFTSVVSGEICVQ